MTLGFKIDQKSNLENGIGTIRELIDHRAATHSEDAFLIGPETGRILTFGDCRNNPVSSLASFRQRGLERGDKIAFLLDNGLFTAQLFLGAMSGGSCRCR